SLKQRLVGPIGSRRSAETLVTTRKKSWRLDGHKLDRQRDWLGVSGRESTSIARRLACATLRRYSVPCGRCTRESRDRDRQHGPKVGGRLSVHRVPPCPPALYADTKLQRLQVLSRVRRASRLGRARAAQGRDGAVLRRRGLDGPR